jgi:hypothetical protein
MIISGANNSGGCCCGCSCTVTPPQCVSQGYCNGVFFGTECGYSYPYRVRLARCREVRYPAAQCPPIDSLGSWYIFDDDYDYYSGYICPDPGCNDGYMEYSVCGGLFCQSLASCLACEYHAMMNGGSPELCDVVTPDDPGDCDPCEPPAFRCPNSCECPCYVP